MDNIKEKSAVGIAVPATETEKTYTASIHDNSEKIKCIMQKPNKISEIVYVNNTVAEIAKAVDGIPSTIHFGVRDLLMVYNRYGVGSQGQILQKNVTINDGVDISGTVLITSMYNNHAMTNEQIQTARAWLLKHTI